MSRKAKSPKELYAEANQIRKTLPKLTGKKNFKARKRIAALEHMARKRNAKHETTAAEGQGLLPNFTSQVTPTTRELAREVIWNALKESIADEMKVIRKQLKLA